MSAKNSYIKVISTGHVIEIYEYEKLPFVPNNKKDKEKDRIDENEDLSFFEEYNRVKNRKSNMQRSRNTLRRLITANFNEGSKFITLTFKNNLKDVKKANYEYMKFIQRLRYRYKDFKYITVIEFQERGAVHYHMMSDLPYIKKDKLSDIWGHGFVQINNIEHVDNVGAYMIKYMTKDSDDDRLQGLKSYQTSRGLSRPIEYVGDQADEVLKMYDLKDKKTVFANSYESEHLGKITYKEYNLKRL